MKKLVLFGAGKIGRSFIGPLFSEAGYEVVFIDVARPLIEEINRRGSYQVIIRDNKEEVITVKNIRGVYAGDEHAVAGEIAGAAIAATAVGQSGLPHIIQPLAKGLLKRNIQFPGVPLDIIIAENLRDAGNWFETELKKHLPPDFPLEKLTGLVETSIGKMVPIISIKETEKDPLKVYAEKYNTLILDKLAFKNPIPVVKGLEAKENMKAWVDRKLFIHNLGHATAAYLGYLHNKDFVYLYEALDEPEILRRVSDTMHQAAVALQKKYPKDFTGESLTYHIDDLISRFRNRALGDTIFRVGCDLPRKLGANDRLTGALRLAQEMECPHDKIMYAMVCGCRFRARGEDGKLHPADKEFEQIYKTGLRNVLTQICGCDVKNDAGLMDELEKLEKSLDQVQGKKADTD